MEGIKYVNLVQIGPAVMSGVEIGNLTVLVNNTLMCCASPWAADIQWCVLMFTVTILL